MFSLCLRGSPHLAVVNPGPDRPTHVEGGVGSQGEDLPSTLIGHPTGCEEAVEVCTGIQVRLHSLDESLLLQLILKGDG